MTDVFPPRNPTRLKTSNGLDYCVERVFCIGRNYAAHAREMGHETGHGSSHGLDKNAQREQPFFFTKWPETVVNAATEDCLAIAYPTETENYHHEVELVVAMASACFRCAVDDALDHVWGYAVGLDMTRRDLQQQAKEKRRPWDTGKNVEQSCPTGRLTPVSDTGHIASGKIELSVNGQPRQSGDISELIWSVPETIAWISRFYTLRAGDLIYTGTPAGVGPVVSDDVITGTIEGLSGLRVQIASVTNQSSIQR
jgi:fumarylpyruvate hydrolase